MKMILAKIIKKIHETKKAKNIDPNHVTLKEIRAEILSMTKNELSNLVNKGELSTGDTINDKYYVK